MQNDEQYRPQLPRQSRRLDIRGCDYCVHEWGAADAPALFLLHGWGDSGATFQFLVDALQREWRVIAPDWRGFGESGRNAAGYWFPDYIADLDGLLTACGIKSPAVLVGHSMGGNVAALFAGVFPGRVGAFVNLEGFGLPDSNPADAPARYRDWIERGRGGRAHPGFATLDELVRRIRERSPRIDAGRAEFVAHCWSTQGDDGRWRLRADPAHRWPNPVLYRRAEAEACWRQVTAPTLLVSGAETAFADAARAWCAGEWLYPNARHVRIDEAGHMLHFEQPLRLSTTIEEFLAEALPGL